MDVNVLRVAKLFSVFAVGCLTACTTADSLKNMSNEWPVERQATDQKRANKGPFLVPSPPDMPRYMFETALRTASDIMTDADGATGVLDKVAGVDPKLLQTVFTKPAAIVANAGVIYVVDTAAKVIVVFDVPRRKAYQFGHRAPGLLAQPAGIALDKEMNVYVADAKARQVLVFDKLGLHLRDIGSAQDLERPAGVAVSPDGTRIYVVDRADNENRKHQVVIYDQNGKKLKVIGTRGAANGEFNVPLQATVAPDGTLYVLDSGNFRVQAFDREGKFLRTFGKLGKNLGDFARPRGIAVDKEGRVYVSDAMLNNVQMFTPKGELLMILGETSAANRPGEYGLVSGVGVDETGRIYIADQNVPKVEVFRPLSEKEGMELLKKAKEKEKEKAKQ